MYLYFQFYKLILSDKPSKEYCRRNEAAGIQEQLIKIRDADIFNEASSKKSIRFIIDIDHWLKGPECY